MQERSVFDEVTMPKKPHWLPVNLIMAFAVGVFLLLLFWLNVATGNMDEPGKTLTTGEVTMSVLTSKLVIMPIFMIAIPLALYIRRGFGWMVMLVLFYFVFAGIVFAVIKHSLCKQSSIQDLAGLPVAGLSIWLLNSYSLKKHFDRDTKTLLMKENVIAIVVAMGLAGWMVFGR